MPAAPNEAASDATGEVLVPPGNPLRPRSLALFVFALFVPFLLMCADLHFAFSVPVGAVACAIAAFALLDVLGTFDDAAVAGATGLRSLAPRLLELTGSTALVVALVRLAVDGRL